MIFVSNTPQHIKRLLCPCKNRAHPSALSLSSFLLRLIQEWCVAHRSMGVERIPTPKQPADLDLVRSLVAQGPGLPALRRLRALARESDKNRLVMATRETRAALLDAAFASGAADELQAEAMAVLALVGLGEAEAAEVVAREDRVARLGKLLAAAGPLEARVNAGAVVEAAASASGADARVALGAAEGVMEGLVALVEEKAHARAVRVGIRGLFALCLAKENRPRAVAAGAASALARRVAEGGAAGEPERALAAVERLCRAEGGRDAVVAGAGGGLAAVAALVRAMSGCAAEHAAGALVAVVGGSEALQVEAVRAGAMRRRRKEERERADGWARFLQGQRSLFMCCGVLETKIKEWSVLCTISKSGVCCAQIHDLGMCHRQISLFHTKKISLSITKIIFLAPYSDHTEYLSSTR